MHPELLPGRPPHPRGTTRSGVPGRRRIRLLLVLGATALVTAGAHAEDGTGHPALDAGSLSVQWMNRADAVVAALSALDRGETARAVEQATAALDEPLGRSDRLAALNALCIAHVAAGRPGAALPYCDRVVAETWGDWRALNNRANALLAVDDLRGAVRDYERALLALESAGGERSVRQYGRDGWQSGRDMLVANLDLARRRLEDGWQVAQAPSPPTP